MNFIRHYLLSLQYFSRISLPKQLAHWVGWCPVMLRASTGHFPGVGLLVGTLVGLFTWALLLLLPATALGALVAVALGTALSVRLTGALHEDGLADVADGLGGSYDRTRSLEIMKDSHLGAFGAVTLLLALLCKVALLGLLGDVSASLLVVALILAHGVSRTWPLLTIRLLANVSDPARSKSKLMADQISDRALATGFVWLFLALALTVYGQAVHEVIAIERSSADLLQALVTALLASLLAWVWMTRWFSRRLGGYTGDCLGATQQVCELAFYLGLAVSL